MNPLPFIKLWGNLLVPLQGEVTDSLAERISSEVLDRVHQSEVDNVIIDISGLWLLDSHICSMLATLAASAELMGTRTFICGMSAEIAQTLQTMDIGLDHMQSARSVEQALEQLGFHVSRIARDANDANDANDDRTDEVTP